MAGMTLTWEDELRGAGYAVWIGWNKARRRM